MNSQPEQLVNRDEEHLRLLAIFHYVVAGLTAAVASLPLLHVAVGLMFIFAGDRWADRGEPPPIWFGWLFVLLGSFFVICGWSLAIAIFYAARCLKRRVKYNVCQIIAALSCLLMPYGTILGVATLVVLSRPAVKQMFQSGSPEAAMQ